MGDLRASRLVDLLELASWGKLPALLDESGPGELLRQVRAAEAVNPESRQWRDQAEHAAESLSKGSRVVVVGRLRQRAWKAEDGSARSVVEVVGEELGPSLRWATAAPARIT